MAGMTDWKPTDSNHVLPNDVNATEFRYRHYINWEVFLGGTLGIGYKNATGSWKIQIIAPNGEVFFEQEVEITLQVFALGSFGLVLFTWNFVKETITTTVAGGVEITDINPAWKYTLGGGELSEQGIFIPGGGSDYSDAMALITAYWESTIYKTTIPVGSTLNVIYDHWGLGNSLRPEYQFAFAEPAQGIDSTIDGYNQLYTAAPIWSIHDGVSLSRAWPYYQYGTTYNTLPGDTPSIAVQDDGKVLLGKHETGGHFIYESIDAMRTWIKNEAINLGDDVTMPKVILLKGGSFIVVEKVDSAWRTTYMGADGVVTKGQFEGTGTEITLSENDSGSVYAINEKGLIIAHSSNGGKTFDNTEATAQ